MEFENISLEEIKKLWKKGETLKDSLFKYSENSLIEKYKKIRANCKNQANLFADKFPQGISSTSNASSELQETIENFNEIQNIGYKLESDVLNKILNEKLIGIGYECPVTTTDFPKVIPLHIWPEKITKINWDDSSFLCEDTEFSKIRIINTKQLTNLNGQSIDEKKIKIPKTKIIKKPGGRPSKKKQIIKAYELLKKENKLDFSTTLKPHEELIQDTIRNLDSTIIGKKDITYKTIYSHLSKLFNKDKEEFLNRL